jgi:hypothetical protein
MTDQILQLPSFDLTHKHSAIMKSFKGYKHSSLFAQGVGDEGKIFYDFNQKLQNFRDFRQVCNFLQFFLHFFTFFL